MTVRQPIVALNLTPEAQKRLKKAARLTRQSPASFAEQATDERARTESRDLRDWAKRSGDGAPPNA
jgi:hypothetical protein